MRQLRAAVGLRLINVYSIDISLRHGHQQDWVKKWDENYRVRLDETILKCYLLGFGHLNRIGADLTFSGFWLIFLTFFHRNLKSNRRRLMSQWHQKIYHRHRPAHSRFVMYGDVRTSCQVSRISTFWKILFVAWWWHNLWTSTILQYFSFWILFQPNRFPIVFP